MDARNLGSHYADLVLASTGHPCQGTLNLKMVGAKVRAWLESPNRKPWLFLGGAIGAGKTTMARAIARTIVEDGKRYFPERPEPLFITAEQFAYSSLDEQTFMTDHKRTILMDDIGTEPEKVVDYGTVLTPFATFINTRYAQTSDRFTMNILTSNKNLAEIESIYGTRVADRILEQCEIVEFNDKSFRKN